jgi:ABC-type phosphate transport system permease subunit
MVPFHILSLPYDRTFIMRAASARCIRWVASFDPPNRVVVSASKFVFFSDVPLTEFLTDRAGACVRQYIITASCLCVSGTLVSSVVALLVGIPLIIAIYLSEFAPFHVREMAGPFLEPLGGATSFCHPARLG